MNFEETMEETVKQIDEQLRRSGGQPGNRTKLLETKAELMKAWALKECADKFYRIG